MSVQTARSLLQDLSDYVGSRMGLGFPRERWGELEKKVAQAASAAGYPDAASFIEWLLSPGMDAPKLEMLSGCLTVGETFFFREGAGLRALADTVIPEIVRAHAGGDRRVRIWCAGCSTGEEPYSVAMMARDCPELQGWDVSILGTDINQGSIRKAKAGVYTEWSFRGVAPGVRERHFRKGDGRTYEISPAIRGMVTFAYLNLIDDVYPALLNGTNALDLILCRNVLMYLRPGHVRTVISRCHRALLPSGWLLVSPVETPLVHGPAFAPVLHAGAILYRSVAAGPARDAFRKAAPTRSQAVRPPARQPRPAPTYSRAAALYGRADYDGAIEILSGLAETRGADLPVFRLLSRAYANKGFLSQAETWCVRAVSADMTSAASHYLLALIRIEQKRPDEAASALRKAICIEPDFIVANMTLANLCTRQGKRAQAGRHVRNALRALESLPADAEVPEAEGMTPARLIEMIQATEADGGTHGHRGIG